MKAVDTYFDTQIITEQINNDGEIYPCTVTFKTLRIILCFFFNFCNWHIIAAVLAVEADIGTVKTSFSTSTVGLTGLDAFARNYF